MSETNIYIYIYISMEIQTTDKENIVFFSLLRKTSPDLRCLLKPVKSFNVNFRVIGFFFLHLVTTEQFLLIETA